MDIREGPDEIETATLVAYLHIHSSPPTALVLSKSILLSVAANPKISSDRLIQVAVNYLLITGQVTQSKKDSNQAMQRIKELLSESQTPEFCNKLEDGLKAAAQVLNASRTPSGGDSRVVNSRLKFKRGTSMHDN